jgi:nitrilase
MRSPEGRTEFRRYWNSAIEVPSPATETLGIAARDNDIYLVIGVIERDGGTLYCTALFFAPDGTLMGKHRKLMPTAMERLIWGFGDGSTLPVFETPLGRIGSVICWENYMPLLRMAMYSKGIQLYCAPTADDRDTWIPTMQHIALEGRCFVLASCQYIKRGSYPEDYNPIQGDDPDIVILRGGSCIIDPFGQILAGPEYEKECILTADIDLGEIARGKYDFDVVGHYARPDVFRLHVNERANPAVVWTSSEPVDPFDDEIHSG